MKRPPGKSNRERRRIAELARKWFEAMNTERLPGDNHLVKVTLNFWVDVSSPKQADLLCELVYRIQQHRRGAPGFLNKLEILDAAAEAKARKGKYRHIAFRFGKSPKQVTDLVDKNKPYFVKKVAELSATNKSK